MNRETYIRKVKKQLDCSVKEKEEIVRDLQEIFDSGKEHGKSESQIIKQLGNRRRMHRRSAVADRPCRCPENEKLL